MRSLLVVAAFAALVLTGCSQGPCKKGSPCAGGKLVYSKDAVCDDCQIQALDFEVQSETGEAMYPATVYEWIRTQPVGSRFAR